ncbi:unnamed protein product [Protopolystoma xenopodis]|uniref:Uncharacterized protein n=1 Tax=Protopolystoma xenopodis TaxID=117903 RepID=A0A448XNZ0_9PLAT|nr:unnamed protein product [Protopolystoma xenopodis]
MFSQNHRTLFFCLPGNPASSFVIAHILLLPALRCLYIASSLTEFGQRNQGCSEDHLNGSNTPVVPSWVIDKSLPQRLHVRLRDSVGPLDQERPEYRRAHLLWNRIEPGGVSIPEASCLLQGDQTSSRLLSCAHGCDLLLVLPSASGATEAGPSLIEKAEVSAVPVPEAMAAVAKSVDATASESCLSFLPKGTVVEAILLDTRYGASNSMTHTCT